MRAGTGSKTRRIKAATASVDGTFEFNKSIVPLGGNSARMQIKQNKKGYLKIRIFQDKNDNGTISKKELIYNGVSQKKPFDDSILNFNGRIHLKKQMHQCDWLADTKRPPDFCTMEYIPTVYNCKLITEEGEIFRFNGVGDYKSDLIQINPNDLL